MTDECCVGLANRIGFGEQLEPCFRGDGDAQVMIVRVVRDQPGDLERDQSVLITWRLAYNEFPTDKLRLLVGHVEVEQLLGGDRTR